MDIEFLCFAMVSTIKLFHTGVMNFDIYGLELREETDSCVLSLKVIPRSAQNKIVGVENGVLKLKIQALPVEGAANVSLIQFLSDFLGRSRNTIEVVKGKKSRRKVVRLKGIRAAEVLDRLQKLKS